MLYYLSGNRFDVDARKLDVSIYYLNLVYFIIFEKIYEDLLKVFENFYSEGIMFIWTHGNPETHYEIPVFLNVFLILFEDKFEFIEDMFYEF